MNDEDRLWTKVSQGKQRTKRWQMDLIRSMTPLHCVIEPIAGVAVLGVGHKARHGKDSACAVMHTLLPRSSRIMAFADDLKALARAFFGMSEKDGALLQWLGAEVRAIDEEHWIKAMYARIRELKPRVVLIPDMRYRNEAAFVKQMGGVTLKVERHNEDGTLFLDPARPATHQSEIDLDDYLGWDFVLRNDLAAAEFDRQVEDWFVVYAQQLMGANYCEY